MTSEPGGTARQRGGVWRFVAGKGSGGDRNG